MRATLLLLSVGLAACQYTAFAEPEAVYKTSDTIGVRYRSTGILARDNEAEAMEIIKRHCGGAFRVTGRSTSDKTTTVDAVCGS